KSNFTRCFNYSIWTFVHSLSYFNNKIIFVGMVFLVIGTGLFKTCASVMVGMLYKKMMQGVILVLLFFICALILVLL
ncbi:hypothetical protein, partial [Raoultella ornithinolytica]|uniref:hypothetical protein n=1 Tax=Raoultella ornithinolytica TaxID=54291 RepID=UPI003F6864BF